MATRMPCVLVGFRDHPVQTLRTKKHQKQKQNITIRPVTHFGHPVPLLFFFYKLLSTGYIPGLGLGPTDEKMSRNTLCSSGAARNQQVKRVITSAFNYL